MSRSRFIVLLGYDRVHVPRAHTVVPGVHVHVTHGAQFVHVVLITSLICTAFLFLT